uniref:Adenylate kinase 5, like n=1 Tax=Esox lucius TaxID=8010 RepID=A0AAY5K4T9_ESOLU
DPVGFLESCLQKVRELGWPEHRLVIPVPGSSPGSFCYERQPPIQAQFSIESDSDMTESNRRTRNSYLMPVGKWELLAKIIANRELAIQETTIEELKQQFIKHQGASRFIVDGFPHETAEAFTFEDDSPFILACSYQQLHQHLEESHTAGSPDDNTHAIENRLNLKHNITPIANFYQKRALIVMIDANQEDYIFTDICAIVKERLLPNWVEEAGKGEVEI